MGQAGTITGPDQMSLGENSRMLWGGVHMGIQGGVWIDFVNGVIDIGGAELDQTDNMSRGFTVPSRGPRTCRVTADCIWRSSRNPIGNLPKIKPLEIGPRVIFWPDYDNDQNQYVKFPISFPLGFVITVAGTADVRFNFGIRNFGDFYWPGNPDPAGALA